MSPRKKTFDTRRGPSRTMAFLPWLASAAAVLTACTDPPIDSNTPDPAGVMEGSVLYRGPRPTCVYDGGVPVAVRGRVILTLFAFKNPPPPEGSATSAMNLLAIPGSALFTDLEETCAPEGVDPDPADIITSSVAFTWPELPLGTTHSASYQVRGFYDHDQTFNPFFNITQVPTAGDISGAAVEDPQASPPVIDEIVFGTQDEFPLGQRVGGVTVSLGLPVNTEPPIFYATSTHLSSETAFALSIAGPAASEGVLLGYTETTLHLYDDLGSPEGVELTTALDAAGLDYAIGPNRPEYRWYVRPVDVDTDAVTDRHPALFKTGIVEQDYLFPIVLIRRRMNEAETSSGVPSVVIVTSLPQHDRGDPTIPPYAEGDILDRDLRVIVPPVAVAITNPALGGVCRVPYFAPGTWSEVYEDELGARLAECQELPTGRYEYTALNGLSGATLNGDVFEGGRYSSQNWTSPNALGVPAQFVPAGAPAPSTCAGDASPCALEQSVTNAFLIYDPDPTTLHARRDTADVACQQTISGAVGTTVPVPAPNWNDQAINAFLASDPSDEFETADQVEAACCEPIEHLCDVPLCETAEDPNAPGNVVRLQPTSTTEIDWNGERRNVPNCLSFHMPAACCPDFS